MKLIIIIIINIEKKNVQNLKWATAHLSRRLGAGRWALRRAGRELERQARRAAGARAANLRARGACAAGVRLGARSSMHGLGVAWALDGCTGWASWASFGAQCTWLSSDSVFGPDSTRYFPESPTEQCSL